MAVVLRRHLFQHADPIAIVGRHGNDRCDDDRQRFRFERLRLRLRRRRRGNDRLRRLPHRHRTGHLVMAFAQRLRRRRFLQQTAATAASARSRRRHEDEAHFFRRLIVGHERRGGRRWAERRDERDDGQHRDVHRAGQEERHARRSLQAFQAVQAHGLPLSRHGAADAHGLCERNERVRAAEGPDDGREDRRFGHTGGACNLVGRVDVSRRRGNHGMVRRCGRRPTRSPATSRGKTLAAAGRPDPASHSPFFGRLTWKLLKRPPAG